MCGNTANSGGMGMALNRSSSGQGTRSTLLQAVSVGISEVEAALARGGIVSVRTSLFMYFWMLVWRLLKRPGLRGVGDGMPLLWAVRAVEHKGTEKEVMVEAGEFWQMGGAQLSSEGAVLLLVRAGVVRVDTEAEMGEFRRGGGPTGASWTLLVL